MVAPADDQRRGGVVYQPSFNVLFLCTGNSARSILAEAIMNRAAPGKFKAYSAGSMPKGEVHPLTLALLESHNFLASEFRSKSWEEFTGPGAPQLDFVFTVCDNAAAEVCPIWPGQPMTAHWGLPDPVSAQGNAAEVSLAFAETYRMLRHRIEVFINLPVDSLDALSLQRRLDAIGKMTDAPASAS